MSDCSDIWIDGDTLFAGIAALAAGRALDKESINTGKVARMLPMTATQYCDRPSMETLPQPFRSVNGLLIKSFGCRGSLSSLPSSWWDGYKEEKRC